MDSSWIPGVANEVAIGLAAVLAAGGAGFAWWRKSRKPGGPAEPSRRAQPRDPASGEPLAPATKPAPTKPSAKAPKSGGDAPTKAPATAPKKAPPAKDAPAKEAPAKEAPAKTPPAKIPPAKDPSTAPAATPSAATEPSAPAEPDTAAPAAPTVAAVEAPETSGSRFARLRSRIRGGLGEALASVFKNSTLTDEDWDQLEESLLLADVGAGATDDLLSALRARLKADAALTPREALRAELLAVVDPDRDRALNLGTAGAGGVETAVVVGVNGVGKTTTVAKLARVLVADGFSVTLGAADTFRAAAADQLQTWGARVGVPVVRADREGADPASVAFTAASTATEAKSDVLLIDTAGRLQNKQGLMDELGKIVRVLSKVREPSEVLLVLDATTGQNGLTQAKVFGEVVPLTGIVLTKLDGTAKGGIVIAVQRELGVPVKFIGLGEGPDDLAPFDAAQFVDSLLGD